MNSYAPWAGKRAAMVIAHPGHELRVHHWVELSKPKTLVLTDGSGRTAKSRLPSTTKILEAAGAKPGPVYGRFTDAAIYDAMLKGEHEVFLKLLDEIAEWLVAEQVDYVAGDALEGYNTSHEVCRYLLGAACELASRRLERAITNFDFLLTGRPDECPLELQDQAICIDLDIAAVGRKLAAAESYPELKHEVEFALRQFGQAAFAKEWLRPVNNKEGLNPASDVPPYYETHGEKQKSAGHYEYVIRQREHLLPLVQALWRRVDGC